jgi:hypothetical protein
MRVRVALLLLLLVDCGGPQAAPQVDRVEMRLSGWSATDVAVNRRGEGQYRLSGPGKDSHGSFAISSKGFSKLLHRLEPFRRQAVPYNDKSAHELMMRECPQGVPSVTDSGAVWVRWVGRSVDVHYLADLGCDAERNASRNKQLLDAIKSLPIPHS